MPGTKIRLALLVSSALALLVTAPEGAARTYKWVDEGGITHYSESKPVGRDVEVLTVNVVSRPGDEQGDACESLSCRAARLTSERQERERAAQKKRNGAAKAAAAYPVFPTPVAETDDEKITRLVAECKQRRGSDCESDEEKRRMLLQNVELSHAERRALRAFSPAAQRRILLQRIPKKYRNIE